MYRRNNGAGTIVTEEKGGSYFLLIRLLHVIVEGHGGQIELDEKTNTFTVTVPTKTKAACYRELDELMEFAEAFNGFPTFIHT